MTRQFFKSIFKNYPKPPFRRCANSSRWAPGAAPAPWANSPVPGPVPISGPVPPQVACSSSNSRGWRPRPLPPTCPTWRADNLGRDPVPDNKVPGPARTPCSRTRARRISLPQDPKMSLRIDSAGEGPGTGPDRGRDNDSDGPRIVIMINYFVTFPHARTHDRCVQSNKGTSC